MAFVIQQIDGLKELEANLAILREEFGVKTGGVIIRGLRAGSKLIQQDAARRAPDKDPSGFLVAREARLSAEAGRKRGRKGVRGRGTIRRTLDMIRLNIEEHAIRVSDPRANGRPTVIVRVRNRGYERTLGGKIRFKNPSSSPGYWWWVEFGTSKMAARPFLRPAFESQKLAAVEAMKTNIKMEIEQLFGKFGIRSARGRA